MAKSLFGGEPGGISSHKQNIRRLQGGGTMENRQSTEEGGGGGEL